MGLYAYAQLTANGNSLTGETTQSSIGNVDVSADHIELYAVDWGSRFAPGESTTTRLRTSRIIDPIRLMKRVDQTTPSFFQALKENHTIAGQIRFFDTGVDGATRLRFTLTISRARVLSVQGQLRDALEPTNSGRPVLETIEILPQSVTYTDEVYSTEYTDG
jgi:type VI secretion system Hcp family effector